MIADAIAHPKIPDCCYAKPDEQLKTFEKSEIWQALASFSKWIDRVLNLT